VRRVVAVVFAAALVFPAAASAHARLLFSSPADGEVLRAPPTAAVLRFDDSVAVGPGNAAVNASGASILGGVPRAHGHVLTIPLSARGNGSFTVRWSVVSDDGHDVSGVIAFAVGSAAVPHATLSARGNGPSALDVLERWLLVGGILLAAGASVFGAAVARLRRVAVLAAAGFVVAGAGALLEWSRVPDSTRFGHAMLVVAVSAAAGAGLAVLAAWRSTFVWAPLPAAAVALVAASLGGHVLDAGVSRLEVGVDVAHFAAAAVWIGGLASLVVALPHADSRVAARFSRLALASVALVAVTGVLRALSELSSVGQVFSTSYGRALIAKSALFVALIGIGYANRSRFLTRRHLLRRSGAAELVVAGILVVAIAVLTSVAPGRVLAAQHESAARETGSGPPPVPPGRALTIAGQLGSRGVALSVTPAGTKLASRVTVLGSSGDGVDGLEVLVAGHSTTRCGFGCYATSIPEAGSVRVAVGHRSLSFALPPRPFRSGLAMLRRIGLRYLEAKTISFDERLSSGPGQTVTSTWLLQAPSSLSFVASDGSSGVIIGSRRWDKQANGPWQPSPQDPRVAQPQLPWTRAPANAVLLSPATIAGKAVERIAFLDRSTPAWFVVTADARTHALMRLDMVAPAHFMRDDNVRLDQPTTIRPPR
jgi:copper transport protein